MINIDLVPIKYITGTYRYDEQYPTPEDLMWDICATGKKSVNVDDVDWIDTEQRNLIFDILKKTGLIKISNNKINIIKTYWDGRCD